MTNVKQIKIQYFNSILLKHLITTRNIAISQIPTKEKIIDKIWMKTLIILLLFRKKPHLLETTNTTLALMCKNTWISLLLKIYIYDDVKDESLSSLLFQIILLECNNNRPYKTRIIVENIKPEEKKVEIFFDLHYEGTRNEEQIKESKKENVLKTSNYNVIKKILNSIYNYFRMR